MIWGGRDSRGKKTQHRKASVLPSAGTQRPRIPCCSGTLMVTNWAKNGEKKNMRDILHSTGSNKALETWSSLLLSLPHFDRTHTDLLALLNLYYLHLQEDNDWSCLLLSSRRRIVYSREEEWIRNPIQQNCKLIFISTKWIFSIHKIIPLDKLGWDVFLQMFHSRKSSAVF